MIMTQTSGCLFDSELVSSEFLNKECSLKISAYVLMNNF